MVCCSVLRPGKHHSIGVLVLLMATSLNMHAQFNNQSRDSLEHLLSVRKRAIERLAPLKELAWSHLFSDKALPYLHELDSLTAILIDDPNDSIRTDAMSFRSWMFYQLGYNAKFHRNMLIAQRHFRDAIKFGQASQDTLIIANGLSAIGITYMALGMPEQALHYYDQELELVLSTSQKPALFTADIHQHKADALMHLRRFQEAESELMQCDTMEVGRHALTYMGLGRLAAFRGDTATALDRLARAKRIVGRATQPWDGITVLEPTARLQLRAGHVQDALATATEAISLARVIGDEAALAGCLVIAGQAHMMIGDPRAAEAALLEAMDIAKRNGYIGLSRETGDDGSSVRAAEVLKELYKAQGRTAEAFAITELWAAWKDTLHRIEGREELLRYDLQQAQLTDSIADAQRVLEATKELQENLDQERSNRKIALALVSGVLCVVALVVFVLLSRREHERMMARHEMQRKEQERMIHDLRMRELMSEDLHEELGAGLSALKLWNDMDLAEETDPRRRQLLSKRSAMADELVASLRQIIWAMNSPSTTVKQLVDYLVDYAHLHCAQHALRLHAECDTAWPVMTLPPELRRNPFLAMKEALNNTVKHSGADRVELRITSDHGLTIDIRDNGSGTTIAPDQLPGSGLRNMKRRITAIGGTLVVDGSQGMHVQIRIPLTTPGN